MKALTVKQHEEAVMSMIAKCGPEEHEYAIVNNLVNSITDPNEAIAFRDLIMPVLNMDTLYGYTYHKPLGYAGDFMLIEKMYQQYVSTDPRCSKWDTYYHTHEATKAVRNRKTYFVKLMEELYAKRPHPLEVLILGSGPATDVCEFFTRNPDANVTFDCLDIDQRAIDYASAKNKEYLPKINFIRMNVLRFVPEKKYDMVWSAGLFDYLNDRLFSGLVGRYRNNLKPGAEMVIGNFSTENPTQRVMEVMGEWFLNHRSSQHLVRLAKEGNFSNEYIFVDNEPLGINLFLKLKSVTQKTAHPANETANVQSKSPNLVETIE